MGIVLREALLNEGFVHYTDAEKTFMILCVDDTPSFYINLIQEDKDRSSEKVTIMSGIKSIAEANEAFNNVHGALALEGFGLSRTGEQRQSQEERQSHSGQPTNQQKRLENVSQEENNILDVLDDIISELDRDS